MTTERAKKKSDVAWLAGVYVPATWRRTKVKHLVSEMRAGDAITSERIEESGNVPVYGGNGVRGFTEAPTHNGVHVLIGRQGALCGNIHLARGSFWASEHAIVGTPARDVDARWLAHLLRTMDLGQYSVAAAQPGIGVAQIAALDAYLPSLEQQEAIADFLDEQTSRIDTLIGKQNQLIETLRERRAAVTESLVTSAASVTSGQRLKHITLDVRQGWSPQCLSWPVEDSETWAVLKAGAANAGRFRPEENKQLPPDLEPRPDTVVKRGDLVVSRANTRELVGSAAVVMEDYPRLMLCDKLYAFRLDPKKARPEFVSAVLATRAIRGLIEVAAGGTSPSMQNISREDIGNLPMDLPVLQNQDQIIREIGKQTAHIDALIRKAEEHIGLAKERRAALITAAVTGQIDVGAAGYAARLGE